MDQCQPVTMSDGITVRVQGDTDKWTDARIETGDTLPTMPEMHIGFRPEESP